MFNDVPRKVVFLKLFFGTLDNIKGKYAEVNSENGKKTYFVKKNAKIFHVFRPAKAEIDGFFTVDFLIPEQLSLNSGSFSRKPSFSQSLETFKILCKI